MEKKNIAPNARPAAGMDADGNMQIRSTGKASRVPTDRSAPEKAPAARRPARRAARTAQNRQNGPVTPAGSRASATPANNDAVEYSFANSGLFNNGMLKDGSTDPTAVSEAHRARAEQGSTLPDTNTRIVPGTGRVRAHKPTPANSGARRPVGGTPGGAPTSDAKPMPPAQNAGTPRAAASFATKVTPAVPKKKSAPRDGSDRPRQTGGIAAMNSITRALIYIAGVILTSVLLSVVIISNCNDIFAFVKGDEQYTITIDVGTDLNRLADQLKAMGVIEHKNTFRFYIKYRHKDMDAYIPGTYTVSSSMSYDQIIAAITPREQRELITITVPEGYTVDQIIDLFVDKGVGTREGFEDVIQNGNFSKYWFVNELPANPDRYYRLEGYLFPDTYYFYTDMEEKTIIQKFLDNFESKYSEAIKVRAAALGFTTDQVVTLASILQAEGKERIISISDEDTGESASYLDYELISSVFHNRMNSGWKLQSDATTLFALTMDKTGMDEVTGSNKNYENPYNTYNIDGFPPGAICNPSRNALEAALYPASSPYYYFASDDKGNTYFAKTIEEHNENVAKIGQ